MAAEDDALVVLGAGTGGIAELNTVVNDAAVQWAVLRFDVGSGAFCRRKFLFLHVNGEECPIVKRGQANAYTAEAQRLLRADNQEGFHASLTVTQKEEVTEEQLKTRVGHLFVQDDMEYTSMQVKERRYSSQSDPGDVSGPSIKTPRETADGEKGTRRHSCPEPRQAGLSFATGRAALSAVAEDGGAWNWVLVKPNSNTLQLVAGGTGSVDEMREHLLEHDTEVLFGFLRLHFGEGRLRRAKHVFVHAVGSRVSTVARGRMMAERPKVESEVQKLAHCHTTFVTSRPQDLTLEAVVERVRRASMIDDAVLDGDCVLDISTVVAAREALEERCKIAPPTPRQCTIPSVVTPRCHTGGSWEGRRASEVVQLLSAPEGTLNWALFGPDFKRIGLAAWAKVS
mmetsp:Transcript_80190/g.158855  ORF Transcript_80190/g.158855 Transcript_80190/m.158855 type:complete len:398 (+) Transcript_80190:94-1287(+)